jgi:PhoH-like ATPase
MKTKIFVFDTNVILHDSSSLFEFGTDVIVIPITVIEELDNFKKGDDTVNFHARSFLRILDSLRCDQLFNDGVEIEKGKSKLIVKLEEEFAEIISNNFCKEKADHKILNCVYQLAQKNPEKQVILITKDVNLRVKANSVGLTAQDYVSDHVKDIKTLYSGKRIVEDVDIDIINKLYEKKEKVNSSLLENCKNLIHNEYLVLKNQQHSVLAKYDAEHKEIKKIEKVPAYGIVSKNVEQTFCLDALLDPSVSLVTICGSAGTGKTLLALAAALETKRWYRQIFLARPIVPLSNKDIGFLPGDIQSKLDPYMQPLYDNLAVIQEGHKSSKGKSKPIKELLEEEKLVLAPLAYIRGRSLGNIYFIVDEAQNLTPHEVKTIITRAGENTKFVFTGDIFQIDHPYLDSKSNGLSYLIEKMQGQKIYSHITLEKGERSELADLASSLL